MGNCQAAEAATVVIQHGGNKVERIYWSVSAHEVMGSNPGHYVALVVPVASATMTAAAGNGTAVKQLKLLRPDDTLVIGQVYRLISFEGTVIVYGHGDSVCSEFFSMQLICNALCVGLACVGPMRNVLQITFSI